jgi:hypothetical protein
MAALLHQLDTYPSQLRIICAPYRAQDAEGNAELESLMDHYAVPQTVRTERAQSVTHSFGTQTVKDESVELSWNHFLNRAISIRVDENARASVANSSWIMSDYILHVRRSQHSGGPNTDRSVTLLCFGAPPAVIQCFRQLESNANWQNIYQEPFLVFDMIYTELFLLVDKVAWALADVFSPVERSTLELAELGRKGTFPEMLNSHMDFAGLHDMSKHCIYLLEGLEAASSTLDAMIKHQETSDVTGAATSKPTAATINALNYRKRTFESTHLRVRSLEKRMANISSLSFHLVTQHDSEIMRDDSKVMRVDSSVMREDSRVLRNDSAAMKMIALLTLVFLPATGVASVLSCPFFRVDFSREAEPVLVAASFRLFWILVLPMTFGTVLVWALYCAARKYGWPSFRRRP